MRQAITWTSDGWDHRRVYASLGLNGYALIEPNFSEILLEI